MKNRKHGPPRIPDRAGLPPRSSEFLDGTVRAYYGPGQRPDAGESGHYVPPTGWPGPGRLLRAPQVAWLGLHVMVPGIFRTVSLPGFNPITHNCFSFATVPVSYEGNYYSDGAYEMKAVSAGPSWNSAASSQLADHASSFGAWLPMDPLPDGTAQWHIVSGDVAPPNMDQTIATPMPAERTRLLAEFVGARDRLADIRAGRTWAVVVDPWGAGDPAGTPFNQHDAFFPGTPGLYWPMMAPSDAAVDSYLGVDWMHIYCGYAAKTDVMLYYWDRPDSVADFAAARDATRPLAIRAGADFYGWSAEYHWLDLELARFSAPPAPAPAYAPPGGYFARGIFPEATDDNDMTVPGPYVSGWTEVYGGGAAAVQALIDAWYDGLAVDVAADNAFNAGIQPASRDMLRADATGLASAGLTAAAVGDTSAITADYLVGRIADRFGFDPGSGADIG